MGQKNEVKEQKGEREGIEKGERVTRVVYQVNCDGCVWRVLGISNHPALSLNFPL